MRLAFAFLLLAAALPCPAATIQLVDGRAITGRIVRVGGVAEDPTNPIAGAGEVKVEAILVIDDGLRRTFVSTRRVRDILDDNAQSPLKIRLWQNHATRGAIIGRAGRLVGLTPFDEHGRRVYRMQGPEGTLAIVQGITEITPVYTRVRGLVSDPRSYVWDMRLATSSIPRETLTRVLLATTPQNDPQSRLQVVRLYLQSKRFRDARRELEAVAKDFPQLDDLDDDIRQLRQLGARAILDEIELRKDAGQHLLVRALLENFPSEEVAGATLERVREMLGELDTVDKQKARVINLLTAAVEAIAEPAAKAVAAEVRDEITAELNDVSIGRLAAFVQLAEGGDLSPEQRAALAISGWLLGVNEATDNLPVALSLFDVRAKVLAYLRSESREVRDGLLIDLRDMEGASVERIAALLKLIKPPLPLPEEAQRGPGLYEFTKPLGADMGDVRYLVQLPPEYDPLRSYPAIVTLGGAGYSPETQLDYWAGPIVPRGDGETTVRMGQAMRRGYVTIAVDWLPPGQYRYGGAARAHHAVLTCLRDAIRRLAIDTDKVFLTGHDAGGDAAWDVAVAHPDHWAGVIPMLATARKYVGWYWQNAEFVPWYFVGGEMDGGKTALNARELDRYLKRARYDTTFAEYLGRGHDPFSDEVQRLFDWMERKRRRSAPEEFTVYTMRPWDNYFWWAEFRELPEKCMVAPATWPPKRGVRACRLQMRKYPGNKLGVIARAGRTTVWLSPDVVDFNQPITVELNGRSMLPRGETPEPSLSVLLEDVRTRGDRFRPFWAKVESR
ncbi:MAG: peptidase [Planctomycetota bacterium]